MTWKRKTASALMAFVMIVSMVAMVSFASMPVAADNSDKSNGVDLDKTKAGAKAGAAAGTAIGSALDPSKYVLPGVGVRTPFGDLRFRKGSILGAAGGLAGGAVGGGAGFFADVVEGTESFDGGIIFEGENSVLEDN